jgi:uncharacterized membrane protein YeaQ/YmgE (transglycosylase-associated protein family)
LSSRGPTIRPEMDPESCGGLTLRADLGDMIGPASDVDSSARQEHSMPHMDIVGWIVVGFLAGALSGAVLERGPHGCLANTLVGILGGLLGGWFATEELHMDSTRGFLGALLVAFLGAIVIRLILDALESDDRRRRRHDRPWRP